MTMTFGEVVEVRIKRWERVHEERWVHDLIGKMAIYRVKMQLRRKDNVNTKSAR